jgi:transposase
VSMTNPTDRVEIITSVQRRRRWTASEKVRIVEETFEPGMTVSLVARRHSVAPNQLFTRQVQSTVQEFLHDASER